jgi:hypothetical protein
MLRLIVDQLSSTAVEFRESGEGIIQVTGAGASSTSSFGIYDGSFQAQLGGGISFFWQNSWDESSYSNYISCVDDSANISLFGVFLLARRSCPTADCDNGAVPTVLLDNCAGKIGFSDVIATSGRGPNLSGQNGVLIMPSPGVTEGTDVNSIEVTERSTAATQIAFVGNGGSSSNYNDINTYAVVTPSGQQFTVDSVVTEAYPCAAPSNFPLSQVDTTGLTNLSSESPGGGAQIVAAGNSFTLGAIAGAPLPSPSALPSCSSAPANVSSVDGVGSITSYTAENAAAQNNTLLSALSPIFSSHAGATRFVAPITNNAIDDFRMYRLVIGGNPNYGVKFEHTGALPIPNPSP